MTKIRLAAGHPAITDRLTRELRAAGFVVETKQAACTDDFRVTYGPAVPREHLQRLLRVVAPLAPQHEVGSVQGADIELCLGLPAGFDALRVRLRVDGRGLVRDVTQALQRLGVTAIATQTTTLAASRLSAAATRRAGFAADLVEWWLGGLPIARPAREVLADAEREELHLDLDVLASSLAAAEIQARVPVVVCCDDESASKELVQKLVAEGLAATMGEAALADRADRLRCDIGASTPARATALEQAVARLLRKRGVDGTKYPVVTRTRDHGPTTIVLPLGRARSGALRPYDGDDVARFDVWIRTDDPASVERLRAQLEAGGFASVHVALSTEPVACWALDRGALDRSSDAGRLLRAAVDEACFASELRGGASELEARRTARVFELATIRSSADDEVDLGATIMIDAPTVAARTGWREELDERRRKELAGARVRLYHEEGVAPARIEAAKERLLALGVQRVHTSLNHLDLREISFSSASHLAAIAIRDLAQTSWEEPLVVERCLPGDPAVFSVAMRLGLPTPRERRRIGERAVRTYDERPFVEVTTEHVRVGETRMARRVSAGTSAAEARALDPLCIDDETAATLDHVARAVVLREPCLLEGETGTTKTASIVWLAAQLDIPLARLNLHGQTDTAELVGRHLPASGGGWRWQEGLLLQAMRQGSWVLLDELNLAEADVLERIDSLLERTPSFVVTEHDFERFGEGAAPIHEGFRLFVTMNPVGYAGRNRLSPAFLDRFRARRFVAPPDEQAYESLLRALVFGVQPAVTLVGRRWNEGTLALPPRKRLAAFARIDDVLARLARLHGAVVAAASAAGHPDVPRPTRRALLSVLDYLDACHPEPAFSPDTILAAVRRAYVSPLPHGAHRDAVEALVTATGLGIVSTQPAGPEPDLARLFASVDRKMAELDAFLEEAASEEAKP